MIRGKLKELTTDQLVKRFADIALAQDEALLNDAHSTFNRLYRQMDEVDDELRARGDAARLALLQLYDHPNVQVRLKAAVRTLAVAPVRARHALETIVRSQHFPQAGDAGMLLSGLDDGSFKPK